MRVGAAGEHVEAAPMQAVRERVGVRADLPLVVAERLGAAILKHAAFAAIVCISGPPCMPGEVGAVELLRVLLAAEHESRRAGLRASCGSSR